MDKNTTLEELKTKVKDFCEQREWAQFHNPKDLAIGISTEANELLQIFRFKSEKDMQELMASGIKIEVEQELADVLYFVLRFAQMNNIYITFEFYLFILLSNIIRKIEQDRYYAI